MAWVPIAIFGSMATAILVLSLRPLGDDRLAAWMEARGVPVTEETRVLVGRELARTRRARAYGVVTILGVQAAVAALHAGQWPDPSGFVVWLTEHAAGWSPPIVGYAIGALAAEWWGARPGTGRRAVVSSRELSGYVSAGLLGLLRWLPAVFLVLAPLPLVMPVEPGWLGNEPSVFQILVLAAGAGLAWAVAELVARRTVERRQPVDDPALVRADDALRSAAVHAVVAVGIALQLLALSGALWAIGASADPTLIRWIFPTAALIALWAAFGMWLGYGATSFPFVVRRPMPPAVRGDEVTA